MRSFLCLCISFSLIFPALSADRQTDLPNPIEFQRWMQKHRPLGRNPKGKVAPRDATVGSVLSGTGKVLVILVEFGGTDTFEFTPTGPNASTWDPIGRADMSEWTGTVGDCSAIVSKYGITAPIKYTYAGPLHNQIERPRSATDLSGWRVWTPDFNAQYYQDLIFGNGVKYDYSRQDGSQMLTDLTGISVRNYYHDMSGGSYDIAGDVVGWVQVPHSVWWYGADPCPGRQSSPHQDAAQNGGIPNAGNADSLVTDAIAAAKAAYPDLDWASYDSDHDGVIDHLMIIAAGLNEADAALLNRTTYGEAGMWEQSGVVSPPYAVAPTVSVGAYVMATENSGVATLAHEFAHSLGAIDLSSTGGGASSAGFWSLMGNHWTGYPSDSEPTSMDPYHLDAWGWLSPFVISNPGKDYSVKIGQTSLFPGASGTYRGVKIQLQDGQLPLPVSPHGNNQWWGGNEDLTNATMTSYKPVTLPSSSALTLTFNTAYQIETGWDFFWIQASADGGATWKTLTNNHTTCNHEQDWIGGDYGFPSDLCGANMGGFTGTSAAWPAYAQESFNLDSFAGQSILLRFWYMTDWGTTFAGPYLDDVLISAENQTVFSDGAESGDANWIYGGTWERNSGTRAFSHAYYLQWRDISQGADLGLSGANFEFGPANSGLAVWYENESYPDNEIYRYLCDLPSFGPKGRMLLVDSQPDPYRDPDGIARGFNNEGANLASAGLMRDAPFSRQGSTGFTMFSYLSNLAHDETFVGRPAVKAFSDALGYYPGAELTSASPNDPGPRWITKQWDSSVVLPSKVPYAMKAPGLLAGQELSFNCTANLNAGALNCDQFGATHYYVPMDGGSGNPGDAGGDYGWNVEIVDQTATQATLHIWNSHATSLPGISSVTNALSGNATIAANTWVAIMGSNLAPDTRQWQSGDFTNGRMPMTLDGVSVTLNGRPAFMYYISPVQLNILTPPDLEPGPVTVIVCYNGTASAPVTVQAAEYSPSFFVTGARPYVLATHTNGQLIGPTDLYPGSSTPARPGETIVVYANGCGATNVPVVSGSPAQSGILPVLPNIQIGGQPATVTFAGLISPGLYQLNLIVPDDVTAGDNAITGSYEGFAMQAGVGLTVQR